MGISGCTSCQAGGAEALKAYDQKIDTQRRNDVLANAAAIEAQKASEVGQVRPAEALGENRPVPVGTVGGIINISV